MLDGFAGRSLLEEMAGEQVFLPPLAGCLYGGRAAGDALEFQQTFEDVDRRVEGAARRADFLIAIPAAIRHLFAQEPVYQRAHVHPKIGAHGDHATIDAGLHFAGEERAVPPADVFVFWQLILTNMHEPFDVLSDSAYSALG